MPDRYIIQVSGRQEIRVKIVQLENASQEERGRKQDARKQLHRVVTLQTQITEADRSDECGETQKHPSKKKKRRAGCWCKDN